MSPPEAMPGKLFLKGEERTAEGRSIYDAYVRYGYTKKEIAEHLGFHYATISRAIKRVEGRCNNSSSRYIPSLRGVTRFIITQRTII